MNYTINVPGLGQREAPDPGGLASASDRTVLDALYTASGLVDPVALQVLADRGLCFRGDLKADIERRIQRREALATKAQAAPTQQAMANHADILFAYISRIKLADLERIAACAESVSDAQLHQGDRSQARAHDALRDACESAVRGLIQHDLALIERATERAQGRSSHLEHQAKLAELQSRDEARRCAITQFYEDRLGRPGSATR